MVLIAADNQLQIPYGRNELRIGTEVRQQVAVHARTGKGSYQSIVPVRVVAGVFKGLVCALQEETMLRVHDCCISRTVTKERSIKELYVFQDASRFDIIGIMQFASSYT